MRYIINPTKQRAAGEKKKATYLLFFSFVYIKTRALNSYLFPFVSGILQFKIRIRTNEYSYHSMNGLFCNL
jgi:hypothetical protein